MITSPNGCMMRLRVCSKDVTRVEIWATALSTFTQPVPDYRTDPKFELGQPVETGPLAEKPDLERVENAARKPPK